MLTDQAIEEFSQPLGLVVLQYSNFELALTRLLEAIQGIDDWRHGDPTAAPSKPLERRLDFLRWRLSDQNDPGFRDSVLKVLQDVEGAIRDRHVCVHGTWFINPFQQGCVCTRKFSKQKLSKTKAASAQGVSSESETNPEPELREWRPSDVQKVALCLCDAARALDFQTWQLKRSRRTG